MKKKGFTLIELLAVIVILAIIALIATPLVLKYIEKSRQESKVDSAYSFVRNLEIEIANFSIKNNGKKYNGQPSDKGYYELTSFENSEIDTTVKGDKPDTIKVCLSSLGQVEKAMFEYGKYYVSYDGKKGRISDKDTYDNFNCSGNVAGSSGDKTVVFNGKLTFTYYEHFSGSENIGDYSNIALSVDSYHELIIDDNEPILVWGKDSDGDGNSDGLGSSWYSPHGLIASKNEFTIILSDVKLEGEHDVRIVKSDKTIDPYVFAIDSVDRFWIYSEDFVAGDVTVTISDTEGNIYETTNDLKFYEMTPYTWGRPVYGAGYKWVEGLPNDVLVNKKDIKVSVTQNINGVDVTKKFEFSNDELKKIYNRDVYYWGNPFIECDS